MSSPAGRHAALQTSPAEGFAGSPNSSSRKKSRSVPESKHVHHRYFENPFPAYSGHPLRNHTEYLDDALGLFRDVYHHYSGVNLQEADTDIYTGTVGVAYACWRLLTMPNGTLTEADKQMAIGLGTRILDAALRRASREEGFLIGEAGVVVVAAIFYSAAGSSTKAEECLREFVKISAEVDFLKIVESSGDELFVGRIGYLDGFLELWKVFPNHKILLEFDVKKIVGSILRSGRHYSLRKGLGADCPLFFYHYGSDYLGAAHGISTILQFLLCFSGFLSDFDMQQVRKSVDFVLQHQMPDGNFPPKFGETEPRDELVHWCHGAPGVIYMLAKAYIVWKDRKYLDAAVACGDVIWKKGLLRKGPGICHGVSGSGYAFLLMYRLTGSEDYLYRAHCFADFMFQASVQDKSRTPDHPYSLFEGVTGSVCFLADLTNPPQACFPFCDVFTDFPSNSATPK